MKKSVLLFAAAALALGPLTTSSAAERGYSCTVEGAATFAPGLTAEDGELQVVFKGELTNCQSTAGAGGATVVAKATVNGNCAYSTTEGIATIKWQDKTKSKVEFETYDAGALVVLSGTVAKSNYEAAQEGDDAFAVLGFNADATKCNTDEGITEAEFTGQTGSGSPN
jgi:hypothetical protein